MVGKSITKIARAVFAQTDPLLAEISGFKGYDDNRTFDLQVAKALGLVRLEGRARPATRCTPVRVSGLARVKSEV